MRNGLTRSGLRRTAAGIALVATAAAVALGGSAAAGPAPAHPEVVVIGTGGTIAGVSESRVSFETYQAGQLPIDELVAELAPELADLAAVSPVTYDSKASGEYTVADYYDLSRLVDEQLQHADAVVITTGTAAMEELAYWLDLTVRSSRPVVVTGAMRPWTVIGSDGPANLYHAVRLAASGETSCFGTVAMMNGQIFPARDVTKTDTLRLDTMDSPAVGALGTVDERQIRLQRAPARFADCDRKRRWQTPFDLNAVSRDQLPRVEIIPSYVAAGGEAVTAFAEAGADGLVFAGTPSPQQAEAGFAAAGGGTALVAASGGQTGAVYVDPALGVIGAGDLQPKKARLLLIAALAVSDDPEQIAGWFVEHGAPEFTNR